MAIRTGIPFCTLMLSSLALPAKENEVDSYFFDNSESSLDQEARLIEGSVAAIGTHPWMAAMTIGAELRVKHCAGSIISPRTVLTAAHCLTSFREANSLFDHVRLIVGTNQYASGGQMLSVMHILIHEDYAPRMIKNDIALMYTSTDIVFNSVVSPITISQGFIDPVMNARVAGWGRWSMVSPSEELIEIDVTTITPDRCVQEIDQARETLNRWAPAVDQNIEICTSGTKGSAYCRGDNGGPLIRADNGQQIGIVSWGFPCAYGAPNVYVKTLYFYNWIRRNTISLIQ